jgi:hypothetical protein
MVFISTHGFLHLADMDNAADVSVMHAALWFIVFVDFNFCMRRLRTSSPTFRYIPHLVELYEVNQWSCVHRFGSSRPTGAGLGPGPVGARWDSVDNILTSTTKRSISKRNCMELSPS